MDGASCIYRYLQNNSLMPHPFAGHAGRATADYTAQHLPSIIQGAIRRIPEEESTSSPKSRQEMSSVISDMIKSEVLKVDDAIGRTVKELSSCPDPLASIDDEPGSLAKIISMSPA
jgi:hypothetical protein